jgi:hypothetical protein
MRRPTLMILIAAFLGACSAGKTLRDAEGGQDTLGLGGTTPADDAGTSDSQGSGGMSGADAAGQSTGGAGSGGSNGHDASVADGRAVGDSAGSGTGGLALGSGGATGYGTAGSASGGRTSSGAGGRTSSGTGGRTSSGTGGVTSVGTGSIAGSATGGQSSTGTGGRAAGGTGGQTSTGTGGAGGGPKILWTDSIATKPSPWGLDGFGVEHPIGTSVTPNDANGANFSVVPDPLGGTGLAIRHFATFDTGGSRSQGGLYGDVNTIFGKQAKSAEGVWVAQEWYFPEAISAKGDVYCWINLWDFHSIDSNRGNRWHTSPGLMLAQDGSMKVRWEWGGPAYNINKSSGLSAVAMPVGRWFDIEMHYVWTDTPSGTITLWIDGQLAIEQAGVQTRDPAHQIVETYLKFYGSTQGRGPWTPTPSLKYTRNVRVAGERIWR